MANYLKHLQYKNLATQLIIRQVTYRNHTTTLHHHSQYLLIVDSLVQPPALAGGVLATTLPQSPRPDSNRLAVLRCTGALRIPLRVLVALLTDRSLPGTGPSWPERVPNLFRTVTQSVKEQARHVACPLVESVRYCSSLPAHDTVQRTCGPSPSSHCSYIGIPDLQL